MRVLAVVSMVGSLMVGCTATALPEPSAQASATVATRSSPAALFGNLSSVFDATPAYRGYQWTRDGLQVRPEEMSTFAGPVHCGWQAATFLGIGWPPGTRSVSSAELRQYIRDARGVVRSSLRDRLALGVPLPSDARATGYRYGSIEIFLSPTDQDDAIYVVGPSAVERWPRSDPMTACA